PAMVRARRSAWPSERTPPSRNVVAALLSPELVARSVAACARAGDWPVMLTEQRRELLAASGSAPGRSQQPGRRTVGEPDAAGAPHRPRGRGPVRQAVQAI